MQASMSHQMSAESLKMRAFLTSPLHSDEDPSSQFIDEIRKDSDILEP